MHKSNGPPDNDDASDTTSFKSANASPSSPSATPALDNPAKLTAEEESSLVSESAALKASANTLFAAADYSSAIGTYDRALSFCPAYLDYDVAVLKANVAACHIKLAEWKEAVEAATRAIECLGRLRPSLRDKSGQTEEPAGGESERVEEVDEDTAARLDAFARSGRTSADLDKLAVKALMRRAKARVELGKWADLQGAQEDYTHAQKLGTHMSGMDRSTVEKALRELPARIERAQKGEVDEMMGKLKELGNGILKPFGLSTENFAFTKDENTGGYSMQFNQGNKS